LKSIDFISTSKTKTKNSIGGSSSLSNQMYTISNMNKTFCSSMNVVKISVLCSERSLSLQNTRKLNIQNIPERVRPFDINKYTRMNPS